MKPPPTPTAEHQRLLEQRSDRRNWKRWGPYLAERAWGTVREDYSYDGSAWSFFTHDMARSKACRWGEDGLAGLCDDRQILCFSLALWNGRDPILKERLFGLSGPEGNHGEDVKELYYYLDATPTHSYGKFLYCYPQEEFPYQRLLDENADRGGNDPEYEILDTGVFDAGRYFDVSVEHAKAAPDQIFIRIRAANRGSEPAVLHLIPQIWFRNTWSWGPVPGPEPLIREGATSNPSYVELICEHETLGRYHVYAEGQPVRLFTDNVTNAKRLYDIENLKAYVKDAFHEHIIRERPGVVSARPRGTKVGLHYCYEIASGHSAQIQLLLTRNSAVAATPFAQAKDAFAQRIAEADEFYRTIQSPLLSDEERSAQRQALAGMLWNKQFYYYDVYQWLQGDNPGFPPPPQRWHGRNSNWVGLSVGEVMSVPDKWEYPWFAAWDSAFHAIPLAMVDIDLAKQQLELLISEKLMHANGQIPAYEWEFSDVNPPVQAWAVWRVYNMDKHAHGEQGDLDFLERCYHKLLLDFAWWVNRKDSLGRNIFQGGFLGLDNVSVFDRSQPLPNGGRLEQADATGWMALFCLDLMAIGLELAQHRPVYEHLGIKFFEHFMWISSAINREIEPGLSLWDEQDRWYYDVVHECGGEQQRSRQLKVRSLVGLVPAFAAMVLEHSWFENLPAFERRYEWLLTHRPDLAAGMACVWTPDGAKCLLSLPDYDRLRAILRRVLDESEFLSPFGVRSLSRYHLDHPYHLRVNQKQWSVRYEPAESRTRLFGGNSNWRGPVWFPTNFMLITALRVYDRFYGEGFQIECPTGSGQLMTLNQVALEIGRRLCSAFLPDGQGRRPMYRQPLLQQEATANGRLLFPEYFDGDTGEGLGAMHQTGWTGLLAKLLDQQAVARRDHVAVAPVPTAEHGAAPRERAPVEPVPAHHS